MSFPRRQRRRRFSEAADNGEIQVLLDKPGPSVEPPMKIQVEYSKDVANLNALKHEIENLLKEKLVFKAEVDLVPEGTLPRLSEGQVDTQAL